MNELQLIKQQADMVIKSVEEIEKVRNEVHEMKEEFQKDIDEIRSTYPLNRGEALLLKHKVDGKTRELTREFFGKFVSKELFSAKKVHLSMGVHNGLKKRFNSITYNTIRHLDFDEAMEYIARLSITDLPSNYLKLTEKQLEIAEKNNDKIHSHYFDKPNFKLDII